MPTSLITDEEFYLLTGGSTADLDALDAADFAWLASLAQAKAASYDIHDDDNPDNYRLARGWNTLADTLHRHIDRNLLP